MNDESAARSLANYRKEQRLTNLQAAVRAIQEEISQLATELDGDLVARCLVLKRNRCMVEAIKLWRAERGTSLREAKDAVDAL